MEPDAHKVRGKAERFADHYTQATLFWNSQTPVEKTHIINAFRFELSRVQTPAVRERMVSGLMNVAPELAEAVADGPRHSDDAGADAEGAADRRSRRKSTTSPALSLFARPGDGSIRTRRVAILVADGVDGDAARGARRAAGWPPARCRGSSDRGSESVDAADGDPIEVDVTDAKRRRRCCSTRWCCRTAPTRSAALAADGRALEFVEGSVPPLQADPGARRRVGAARKGGHPADAAVGRARPGPGRRRGGRQHALEAFIAALAEHRHFARETDPPRV